MSESQDPYCYPGTNVLKNLGDYRDPTQLAVFESESLSLAFIELQVTPLTLPFGPARLKETHRHLFKDIYPWTGAFRENTGRMTKHRHNSYVTYADSTHLHREMNKVFVHLAAEDDLQN